MYADLQIDKRSIPPVPMWQNILSAFLLFQSRQFSFQQGRIFLQAFRLHPDRNDVYRFGSLRYRLTRGDL